MLDTAEMKGIACLHCRLMYAYAKTILSMKEKTMQVLGIALFVLLWWASGAEAACSGSGTTWSCPAGSTVTDVQSAVNSATDGATITFATGTYTWSSGTITLDNAKGVTLICASLGGCTVTAGSNTMIGMSSLSGNNTHSYRISGFAFQNGNGCLCIWIYGPGTLNNFRLDHTTWTNFTGGAFVTLFGEQSTNGYYYGVLDHNTVTGSSNILLSKLYGPANAALAGPYAGTSQNLFLEDNVMNFSTMDNAGAGCLDGQAGGTFVIRFNEFTNCLVTAHGTTHGAGVTNYEIYGNKFIQNAGSQVTNCYRCVHHQGSGEMLYWNNLWVHTTTPISGQALSITHYRSGSCNNGGAYDCSIPRCDGTNTNATFRKDGNLTPQTTYYGYPCFQQPSRVLVSGGSVYGNLYPIYAWQNVDNSTGNQVPITIEDVAASPPPSVLTHLQANREYYDAVSNAAQSAPTSPFNGTTGLGYGTLVNRPAACTHTTAPDGDNGGGVGYWATDQGSWNGSTSNPYGVQFNGSDGVLYRCSATNTWTVHYTPYTYPHPLQAGGGGDTTPPSAPSNLRVQ